MNYEKGEPSTFVQKPARCDHYSDRSDYLSYSQSRIRDNKRRSSTSPCVSTNYSKHDTKVSNRHHNVKVQSSVPGIHGSDQCLHENHRRNRKDISATLSSDSDTKRQCCDGELGVTEPRYNKGNPGKLKSCNGACRKRRPSLLTIEEIEDNLNRLKALNIQPELWEKHKLSKQGPNVYDASGETGTYSSQVTFCSEGSGFDSYQNVVNKSWKDDSLEFTKSNSKMKLSRQRSDIPQDGGRKSRRSNTESGSSKSGRKHKPNESESINIQSKFNSISNGLCETVDSSQFRTSEEDYETSVCSISSHRKRPGRNPGCKHDPVLQERLNLDPNFTSLDSAFTDTELEDKWAQRLVNNDVSATKETFLISQCGSRSVAEGLLKEDKNFSYSRSFGKSAYALKHPCDKNDRKRFWEEIIVEESSAASNNSKHRCGRHEDVVPNDVTLKTSKTQPKHDKDNFEARYAKKAQILCATKNRCCCECMIGDCKMENTDQDNSISPLSKHMLKYSEPPADGAVAPGRSISKNHKGSTSLDITISPFEDDVYEQPAWTCTKWSKEDLKDKVEDEKEPQWAYEVYSDTNDKEPQGYADDDKYKSYADPYKQSTATSFDNEESSTKPPYSSLGNSADEYKSYCLNNYLTPGHDLSLRNNRNDIRVANKQVTKSPHLKDNFLDDLDKIISQGNIEGKQKNGINIDPCDVEDVHRVETLSQFGGNMKLYSACHEKNSGSHNAKLPRKKGTSLMNSNPATNAKFVNLLETEASIFETYQDLENLLKNEQSDNASARQTPNSVDENLMRTVHSIKTDIESVLHMLNSLENQEEQKDLKSVLNANTMASIGQLNAIENVNCATDFVKRAFQKLVSFKTNFVADNTEEDEANEHSYDDYVKGKDDYMADILKKEEPYNVETIFSYKRTHPILMAAMAELDTKESEIAEECCELLRKAARSGNVKRESKVTRSRSPSLKKGHSRKQKKHSSDRRNTRDPSLIYGDDDPEGYMAQYLKQKDNECSLLHSYVEDRRCQKNKLVTTSLVKEKISDHYSDRKTKNRQASSVSGKHVAKDSSTSNTRNTKSRTPTRSSERKRKASLSPVKIKSHSAENVHTTYDQYPPPTFLSSSESLVVSESKPKRRKSKVKTSSRKESKHERSRTSSPFAAAEKKIGVVEAAPPHRKERRGEVKRRLVLENKDNVFGDETYTTVVVEARSKEPNVKKKVRTNEGKSEAVEHESKIEMQGTEAKRKLQANVKKSNAQRDEIKRRVPKYKVTSQDLTGDTQCNVNVQRDELPRKISVDEIRSQILRDEPESNVKGHIDETLRKVSTDEIRSQILKDDSESKVKAHTDEIKRKVSIDEIRSQVLRDEYESKVKLHQDEIQRKVSIDEIRSQGLKDDPESIITKTNTNEILRKVSIDEIRSQVLGDGVKKKSPRNEVKNKIPVVQDYGKIQKEETTSKVLKSETESRVLEKDTNIYVFDTKSKVQIIDTKIKILGEETTGKVPDYEITSIVKEKVTPSRLHSESPNNETVYILKRPSSASLKEKKNGTPELPPEDEVVKAALETPNWRTNNDEESNLTGTSTSPQFKNIKIVVQKVVKTPSVKDVTEHPADLLPTFLDGSSPVSVSPKQEISETEKYITKYKVITDESETVDEEDEDEDEDEDESQRPQTITSVTPDRRFSPIDPGQFDESLKHKRKSSKKGRNAGRKSSLVEDYAGDMSKVSSSETILIQKSPPKKRKKRTTKKEPCAIESAAWMPKFEGVPDPDLLEAGSSPKKARLRPEFPETESSPVHRTDASRTPVNQPKDPNEAVACILSAAEQHAFLKKRRSKESQVPKLSSMPNPSHLDLSIMKLYDEISKLRMQLENSVEDTIKSPLPTVDGEEVLYTRSYKEHNKKETNKEHAEVNPKVVDTAKSENIHACDDIKEDSSNKFNELENCSDQCGNGSTKTSFYDALSTSKDSFNTHDNEVLSESVRPESLTQCGETNREEINSSEHTARHRGSPEVAKNIVLLTNIESELQKCAELSRKVASGDNLVPCCNCHKQSARKLTEVEPKLWHCDEACITATCDVSDDTDTECDATEKFETAVSDSENSGEELCEKPDTPIVCLACKCAVSRRNAPVCNSSPGKSFHKKSHFRKGLIEPVAKGRQVDLSVTNSNGDRIHNMSSTVHDSVNNNMKPSDSGVWPSVLTFHHEATEPKSLNSHSSVTVHDEGRGDYQEQRTPHDDSSENKTTQHFAELCSGSCSRHSNIYFALDANKHTDEAKMPLSHKVYCAAYRNTSATVQNFSQNQGLLNEANGHTLDFREISERKLKHNENDSFSMKSMPLLVKYVKDFCLASTKAQTKNVAHENPGLHSCPAKKNVYPRVSAEKLRREKTPVGNASNHEVPEVCFGGYIQARRKQRDVTKPAISNSTLENSPITESYVSKKKHSEGSKIRLSSKQLGINADKNCSVLDKRIGWENRSHSDNKWTSKNVVVSCGMNKRQMSFSPQASAMQLKPTKLSDLFPAIPCEISETDTMIRHYSDDINSKSSKNSTRNSFTRLSGSSVSKSQESGSDRNLEDFSETDSESTTLYEGLRSNSTRDKSASSDVSCFDDHIENSRSSSRSSDLFLRTDALLVPNPRPAPEENSIIASFESIMQQKRPCYVENCGIRQKKRDSFSGAIYEVNHRKINIDQGENNNGTPAFQVLTVANDNNSSIDLMQAKESKEGAGGLSGKIDEEVILQTHRSLQDEEEHLCDMDTKTSRTTVLSSLIDSDDKSIDYEEESIDDILDNEAVIEKEYGVIEEDCKEKANDYLEISLTEKGNEEGDEEDEAEAMTGEEIDDFDDSRSNKQEIISKYFLVDVAENLARPAYQEQYNHFTSEESDNENEERQNCEHDIDEDDFLSEAEISDEDDDEY